MTVSCKRRDGANSIVVCVGSACLAFTEKNASDPKNDFAEPLLRLLSAYWNPDENKRSARTIPLPTRSVGGYQ